jgi:hypothetical protein
MRNMALHDNDNQTDEQTARKRIVWNTPRISGIAANESEADQGGIHFDGQGFIS